MIIFIIMIWVIEYYLIIIFCLYQEKDDNQKAKADRKLLADDIVDLLVAVVPCLQVSNESVRAVIILKHVILLNIATCT